VIPRLLGSMGDEGSVKGGYEKHISCHQAKTYCMGSALPWEISGAHRLEEVDKCSLRLIEKGKRIPRLLLSLTLSWARAVPTPCTR